MQIIDATSPITAIVYRDGQQCEAYLKALADTLTADGQRVAGLIHQRRHRADRRKCDVDLRDLASGRVHVIFDDRGPDARGCLMNNGLLLSAVQTAEARLSSDVDLLVLCKFGKAEMAGGGLRSIIAAALELSIPVVIGVPEMNVREFRKFAGDLACEVNLEEIRAEGQPLVTNEQAPVSSR